MKKISYFVVIAAFLASSAAWANSCEEQLNVDVIQTTFQDRWEESPRIEVDLAPVITQLAFAQHNLIWWPGHRQAHGGAKENPKPLTKWLKPGESPQEGLVRFKNEGYEGLAVQTDGRYAGQLTQDIDRDANQIYTSLNDSLNADKAREYLAIVYAAFQSGQPLDVAQLAYAFHEKWMEMEPWNLDGALVTLGVIPEKSGLDLAQMREAAKAVQANAAAKDPSARSAAEVAVLQFRPYPEIGRDEQVKDDQILHAAIDLTLDAIVAHRWNQAQSEAKTAPSDMEPLVTQLALAQHNKIWWPGHRQAHGGPKENPKPLTPWLKPGESPQEGLVRFKNDGYEGLAVQTDGRYAGQLTQDIDRDARQIYTPLNDSLNADKAREYLGIVHDAFESGRPFDMAALKDAFHEKWMEMEPWNLEGALVSLGVIPEKSGLGLADMRDAAKAVQANAAAKDPSERSPAEVAVLQFQPYAEIGRDEQSKDDAILWEALRIYTGSLRN